MGLQASSAYAHGETITVYGVDGFGNPVGLPPSMCVQAGQRLRLQPDELDWQGNRRFSPLMKFNFRSTTSMGRVDQWNINQGHIPHHPFRPGNEAGTVYFHVPMDLGAYGSLEIFGGMGDRPTLISLVDNSQADPAIGMRPCEWPSPSIYVAEQPAPPAPPAPVPVPPAPPAPPAERCTTVAFPKYVSPTCWAAQCMGNGPGGQDSRCCGLNGYKSSGLCWTATFSCPAGTRYTKNPNFICGGQTAGNTPKISQDGPSVAVSCAKNGTNCASQAEILGSIDCCY